MMACNDEHWPHTQDGEHSVISPRAFDEAAQLVACVVGLVKDVSKIRGPSDSEPVLPLAARWNAQIVRLLLDAAPGDGAREGMLLHVDDEFGERGALDEAACRGRVDVVKELLVTVSQLRARHALAAAGRNYTGVAPQLQAMLDRALVSTSLERSHLPLHPERVGQAVEIATALLDAGAALLSDLQLSAGKKIESGALHEAAKWNAPLVALLVHRGEDVWLRTEHHTGVWDTALVHAARCNNIPAFAALCAAMRLSSAGDEIKQEMLRQQLSQAFVAACYLHLRERDESKAPNPPDATFVAHQRASHAMLQRVIEDAGGFDESWPSPGDRYLALQLAAEWNPLVVADLLARGIGPDPPPGYAPSNLPTVAQGHVDGEHQGFRAERSRLSYDKPTRNPERWHTALHYAADGGNADSIRALIAAGADVGTRSHVGDTPLHSAARALDTESVLALLAAGADINATDDAGSTALHVCLRAPRWPPMDVVSALLAGGADVFATDKAGKTAFETLQESIREGLPSYDVKSWLAVEYILKAAVERATAGGRRTRD